MPLSFEAFVQLYLLQGHCHKDPLNRSLQESFQTQFNYILDEAQIESLDEFAEPLFESQPDIPFVLYKPKQVSSQHSLPLIIHTHGGPYVYMEKGKPHAEIAWFLSQGYVVACPNYRGSTGYPDKDELKRLKWFNYGSEATGSCFECVIKRGIS